MITYMLIDDEKPALAFLERMLSNYIELKLVGAYTDPEKALEVFKENPVDVVFLDIEMRTMNGLEAAAQIGQFSPQTEIIFVTAYSEFAIEAFELRALDYLLKPLQRSRVDRMIHSLQDRVGARKSYLPKETTQNHRLQCFSQLKLLGLHNEATPLQWRTQKTQEVFALLLHNRSKSLQKWQLTEWLWPNLPPEKAAGLLHTSIYYVRRLIKEKLPDIRIHYENDGYRLELGEIILDTEQWESDLQAAPPLNEHSIEIHLQLHNRYLGDYLEKHGYSWAETEIQRLRQLWGKHALALAGWLEHNNRLSEASSCYQAIQIRLAYQEDSYLGLMRIFNQLQEYKNVRQQYQTLSQLLKHDLDITPSELAQRWFKQWEINRRQEIN